MKKLLILFIATSIFVGCKKDKDQKEYNVTMTITGEGTYKYQIGADTGDGVVNGTKIITGVGKTATEDYIGLSAHATGKYPIKIELDIPEIGNFGETDMDPEEHRTLYKIQ